MYKKPVISVVINNVCEEVLKEILAGIEEEGVLYEIISSSNISCSELASEGSAMSALSIGVGIFEDKVCVHARNMAAWNMLFKGSIGEGQNIRNIGSNAARYVKGIPFKEVG